MRPENVKEEFHVGKKIPPMHPPARHYIPTHAQEGKTPPRSPATREFTPAEKSFIRKVHGYMPAEQLLRILNERMACDVGSDAAPHTMEQLYAEIGDAAGTVPAGGHDWASLRKLIAKAKLAKVLDSITEQVINDFAVVYSLNTRQLMGLKDIVLRAKDGDEA